MRNRLHFILKFIVKREIISIFVSLSGTPMKKNAEPTIHDIARELNISASTVSRALNNNPRISLKTKEKIKQIADELGYRPNTLASNLRNKKSNTIGIVVPLINRHFFSSVISGVEDVAYQAGYTVVISQSNDLYSKEINIVHSMFANRVDGLIISTAMQTENFDHLKLFRKKNIPLVLFDREIPEIETDKIIIDDFDGGFKVTEHLIQQGYQRISHISGPLNLMIYSQRKNGYLEALKKYGIPFDQSLLLVNRLTKSDSMPAVQQLMNLPNPPDAIFCGNDTTALAAMIYLRDLGVRIPEDMGIVGFSDEPYSKVVSPSISTIAQPGFEMGQKAAELMIMKIEKRDHTFHTIVLPSELIVRESSNRLAKKTH